MTLRFDLVTDDGTRTPGPLMPQALQNYIAHARTEISSNVALLVGVDPYHDEIFDGSLLIGLRDVAASLRDELRGVSWERVPSLPPLYDDDTPSDGPMTLARVLIFLDQLHELAESAIARDARIVTRSD
jgi:hypothetical protein